MTENSTITTDLMPPAPWKTSRVRRELREHLAECGSKYAASVPAAIEVRYDAREWLARAYAAGRLIATFGLEPAPLEMSRESERIKFIEIDPADATEPRARMTWRIENNMIFVDPVAADAWQESIGFEPDPWGVHARVWLNEHRGDLRAGYAETTDALGLLHMLNFVGQGTVGPEYAANAVRAAVPALLFSVSWSSGFATALLEDVVGWLKRRDGEDNLPRALGYALALAEIATSEHERDAAIAIEMAVRIEHAFREWRKPYDGPTTYRLLTVFVEHAVLATSPDKLCTAFRMGTAHLSAQFNEMAQLTNLPEFSITPYGMRLADPRDATDIMILAYDMGMSDERLLAAAAAALDAGLPLARATAHANKSIEEARAELDGTGHCKFTIDRATNVVFRMVDSMLPGRRTRGDWSEEKTEREEQKARRQLSAAVAAALPEAYGVALTHEQYAISTGRPFCNARDEVITKRVSDPALDYLVGNGPTPLATAEERSPRARAQKAA